jgi:hypothetical protein
VLANRRSGNIVSGTVLSALGLVAALGSIGIDEGAGGNLHPRSFPLTVSVLLFLGGGALAIKSLVSTSGADRAIDWPDAKGWKLWGVALGSLVVYVALAPLLGFLIASFFFVTGLVWYLGRYHPLLAAACALGTVAFIYVTFVWLLELTLPQGLLS